MIQIYSLLACALAIFAFAFDDAAIFGGYVQKLAVALGKDVSQIVTPYRETQLMFQFTLYALFVAMHLYGALAGFAFAHWAFGADWMYYVLRREDYAGYTITWFALSLPSLVFKLIGKPFTGASLKWIGPVAIACGLVIAVVFA